MSDKSGPPKAHFNPKFSQSQVHVNPKFKAVTTSSQPTTSIHVNPKFANRPLPEPPASTKEPKSGTHLNPAFLRRAQSLMIDANKKQAFAESIEKTVASKKVFVNPNFQEKRTHVAGHAQPTKGNSSSVATAEKENLGTVPSVPRKKVFKKIGSRKLIRIKTSSSAKPSPGNKSHKKSPNLVYRKTNKSPVTPLRRGNLFFKLVTPLSLRKMKSKPKISPFLKNRLNRTHSAAFAKRWNPFKLDRRPPAAKVTNPEVSKAAAPTTTPKTTSSLISPKMAKSLPPPKPVRSRRANKETLVNIEGVRFKVSENGKKLNRVTTEKKQDEAGGAKPILAKKLFIAGEEFVEDEPGVLIRSRNSMTRQSITSYKNRSINTILKSQMRSRQYCMFFNKFGKCTKREKGVCPYIHDPQKIAVCRKFLQGNCFKDNCLLSHQVAPEKMPACKFFLDGLCVRENCPYSHVKVNPDASVCPEYLKGFCSAGTSCKKRHVSRCPQFEQYGQCSKGKACPYPHRAKTTPKTTSPDKKRPPPPAKPARKSLLRMTPTPQKTEDGSAKSKKSRYFDVEQEKAAKEQSEEEECQAKRKRLEESEADLDDSGPYEEIDETPARAPLGRLPSYIPLDSGLQEDEEESQDFDERLI